MSAFFGRLLGLFRGPMHNEIRLKFSGVLYVLLAGVLFSIVNLLWHFRVYGTFVYVVINYLIVRQPGCVTRQSCILAYYRTC